jgi:hypothetical protein
MIDKFKSSGTRASAQDAVDKLPLSIMPLSSSTLRSAHLVKNAQMETMLELHSDPLSGSLQIRPQDIAASFPVSQDDQAIINKLATLNSYDVYSLRANLNRLGIKVDDKALELSDALKGKLADYSIEFTRPLILRIFGDGNSDIADAKNLQKLFHDPDVARVRARLNRISEKTGMPVEEIPAFLQSYADLFLSCAYYEHGFANIGPDIDRFWLWLADVKTRREAIASPRALKSCRKVEEGLQFVVTSIRERPAEFKAGFERFWRDMNKKSFERLRRQVENNNVAMGAVLCGVTVKIRDWSKTFPDNTVGSPAARVRYVMEKLEPGLEKLKAMENDARLLSSNF